MNSSIDVPDERMNSFPIYIIKSKSESIRGERRNPAKSIER